MSWERLDSRKAFGDSVAFTFVSEARGRIPTPVNAPKTRLRPLRLGFVHSAVKNRQSREKHDGFACRSHKQQLELDLRYK
jgi:hypothetical protein